VVDKVSQNLWAELLLREVARVRTGIGSREAGLEEMKAFLKEAGLSDSEYQFEDASGLSRLGLVTPEAVTRLLRYMHASRYRDEWLGAFPIGGADGTLAKRFGNEPEAKAILAKTGSLSHVNALSGYAESATYGEIAFSILVNNTKAPASEVRGFIDTIGMILLD
jgi:D-alanyl-D-alanine carboxypeptidase/D-alanyl-D-alanine-endopeptidase (penicillin-binding protein 4)